MRTAVDRVVADLEQDGRQCQSGAGDFLDSPGHDFEGNWSELDEKITAAMEAAYKQGFADGMAAVAEAIQ